MKKLWNRITHSGKLGVIEFIISVLAVISNLLLLVLDFNGVISLQQEDLICIAIILLGILIASSLIERFGILSSIFESLAAPDKSHVCLDVRDEYNRLHPVDDCYSDITEMCILGITNISFLSGNGIMRLEKAAQKGVKVKLLSLAPDSDLVSAYEESGLLNSLSGPLSANIETYRKARQDNEYVQKKVTMKVCYKIIPYSMMILKKNGQIKTMKIDLYSNNVEYPDRKSLIIPPTDKENIDFFLHQWNVLWDQDDNMEIT